jgi:hypothetical protein
MRSRSDGMRGLHATACFGGKACYLSMGAIVKARIMEASLRVPI